MWARIKAVFRSLFGWMLRGVEDPELLLRQHMDDLRERVPEMNRQVAEVVKLEKMLEMQVDRLNKKIQFLEPRVVQAVKLGPEKKEASSRRSSRLARTSKRPRCSSTRPNRTPSAPSGCARPTSARYASRFRSA
jgi:phage shock protein A